MNFEDVKVEDAVWARPLLEENNYRSCEFAFVNIYMWKRIYNTKIARFKNFVIARSEMRRLHYLYPAGHGDMKEAIDAILQDAKEVGKEPVIFSLTEEAKNQLEELYPGKFVFDNPRGESDYIYLSESLANLGGKKMQKKRNLCSRFERDNPDWEFHEISPESLEDICAFNNRWCRLYDNRGDEGIEEEHRAIELACRHYQQLNLKGGYITANGQMVAFSFGSPLGNNMFVTHVEKALYDVTGAYNIINREMARKFCTGYEYINRENDVDEEGLRTAKLSYQPAFLEEKYTAELKTN
ncbi:phosphatidylglycerol lysyltransferase domain-containing protein [Ruminococcaceae bacterium OttesenSCG-928-A16]|nr:phosphatidylglycerol lysyltransferase domain-containing protein [Ruminococcaceae bacterium OttesenSCG-928-A16]